MQSPSLVCVLLFITSSLEIWFPSIDRVLATRPTERNLAKFPNNELVYAVPISALRLSRKLITSRPSSRPTPTSPATLTTISITRVQSHTPMSWRHVATLIVHLAAGFLNEKANQNLELACVTVFVKIDPETVQKIVLSYQAYDID